MVTGLLRPAFFYISLFLSLQPLIADDQVFEAEAQEAVPGSAGHG